ncbi:MAG TPA: hypothetical protein DD670_01440 [Planctomycetaceae bacterium]|nr:hypothetical protein [Planctomycetaceae bacterium]
MQRVIGTNRVACSAGRLHPPLRRPFAACHRPVPANTNSDTPKVAAPLTATVATLFNRNTPRNRGFLCESNPGAGPAERKGNACCRGWPKRHMGALSSQFTRIKIQKGQLVMIIAICRGMVVLSLLAASAIAQEPANSLQPRVLGQEASSPTVATVGSSSRNLPASDVALGGWHNWEGSPGDCESNPCDCFSCCTFCEKLAAPPMPGQPDWFVVGRITCRTPPHQFWYGEAAAVGLFRDASPSGGPVASLDGPDNIVLRASQAFPDFCAGGMARLGRMFTPKWGFEYGFLGTGSWTDSAAVRDDTANTEGGFGNLFSPFGDFGDAPIEGFDYNELVSIHGKSSIESHEFNLRQRLCMPPDPLQVSVFYGIRYISLGEQFGYFSQSQIPLPGGATQSVDVHTQNDLLGGQLGALFELHVEPRWWIDARLSAALYHNRAGQTTLHEETGPFASQSFRQTKRNRGTVGAEASIACAYAVTQRLTFRCGYQFVWFDRIALATENFQTNPALLVDGPVQLDTSGSIMYHGPFLGATMAW